MFCPNCGNENSVEQNYCRSCGIKLDAIARAVSEQFPSEEYAALQRRKERFEKLGLVSLSIAGFVGLSLLMFVAAYYKLILLGPELLYGSAIGAVIGFVLLSVFFFNYPKLFMRVDRSNGRSLATEDPTRTNAPTTSKLIDDRPFEPVPSVTEHSTELLLTQDKRL